MQLAGTTSWRMGTDEPQSLLMALYVRDTSGLRHQVDPDIPLVEPAVPFGEKRAQVDSLASAQWADWWQQLLDGGGFWPDHKSPPDMSRLRHDPELQRIFYWPSRHLPPDFVGLSGTPELQALVRRHYEAARVWSEARKHEFVALTAARQRVSLESEIVRTVERGLGTHGSSLRARHTGTTCRGRSGMAPVALARARYARSVQGSSGVWQMAPTHH